MSKMQSKVYCPYIKNGLIAWFDGINKGNDSTAWIDQVNGIRMEKSMSGITDINNGYSIYNGQFFSNDDRLSTPNESSTIEAAFMCNSPTVNLLYMPKHLNELALGIDDYGIIYSTSNMPLYDVTDIDTFNKQSTISVSTQRCLYNFEQKDKTSTSNFWGGVNGTAYISGRNWGMPYKLNGNIYCLRIYSRQLSAEEMLYNQQIDNERFNLGLII